MTVVASGPKLSGLLKLRLLAFDKSEPYVGVRSSEREGSLDGVGRYKRLSRSDSAVLDPIH